MKKLFAVLLMAVAGVASAQVSVNIGGRIAPGVYGSIELGDQRPQLVYQQPVLVENRGFTEPTYVYVPYAQTRDWRRYCNAYLLCDRPVYFVSEDWYQRSYVPRHGNRNDWRRNEELRRQREWNQRQHERNMQWAERHGPDRRGHDSRPDRDHDGRPDHGDRGDHGRK